MQILNSVFVCALCACESVSHSARSTHDPCTIMQGSSVLLLCSADRRRGGRRRPWAPLLDDLAKILRRGADRAMPRRLDALL